MRTKRTKAIVVRLSEQEHRALFEKARAAGVPASSLLREHIRRVRIYNRRTTMQWLCALLSIRNNLTDLVERAGHLASLDAALLIAYAAAIHRKIARLTAQTSPYASKVLPSARHGRS